MSSTAAPPIYTNRSLRKPILLLWLMAGVAMVLFLGGPDVSRTQEARVLETAREMLGSGWRGWMIPHINGQVRLEKPPLTYWMAATSFKIFRVSPAAGRLPFALLGWLTVGLIYRIGSELFDRAAGFAAAAALMGSLLFFRNMRLAETDGPAAFFATAGIWWMWRGFHRGKAIDLQLSAVAIALASMSKQAGLIFPLVFLVAWVVIERRWKDGLRWITSGAPLIILVLAAPWWIITLRMLGAATFRRELHDVTTGRDHFNWPWIYIPWLVQSVLPWIGLVAVAIAVSLPRWLIDSRIRFLLIWSAAIFVPLCCIGNKQLHYLLPLMMPLMLLTGWLGREALKKQLGERAVSWFRFLLLITILACPVAAGAMFFVTPHVRGAVAFSDVVLAGLLVVFSAWGLAVYGRNPAAAALLLFCAAGIIMPYATGKWAPSLTPYNHFRVAQNLEKKFGQDPMCFYGKEESVPLAFALGRIVPQFDNVEALSEALRHHPHLVVLIKKNSMPVPGFLEEKFKDTLEKQTIRGYVGKPNPSPIQRSPPSTGQISH